jgi:hypothetical protein
MHPFVFRPFCVLSQPELDCSDGWTMYQYIAIFATLGYRRWEANALIIAALLTWFYGFKHGLPAAETIFHFTIGTVIGIIILILSKPPKLVEVRSLQNYTGIISQLFLILLGASSFVNVDERITESNARYGVVVAFIIVLCWTLVFTFTICQFNGLMKQHPSNIANYWKMWAMFSIAICVIMTTALCGAIGGYIKGLMVLLLAPTAILLLNKSIS